MRFPGFIGPSYTLQSKNVDAQRCVNLFPEINQLGTGKEREVASLVPTPGLTKRVTLAIGNECRGVHGTSTGELYAVAYNRLYQIDSNWNATELGTITGTTSGPVSMADNGIQLVLVDGSDGYAYNMSTDTFAQITDPDFRPADTVTYLDGYFIFNEVDTETFFISALKSVDFDALDIATAESKPDLIVGVISAFENLYVYGKETLEIYYNSGNVDFPFERIQGAVSGVGASAVHSIRALEDTICWLGGDKDGRGIVYRLNGYRPVRISTPAIEQVIADRTQEEIAASTAWTYQQGGHHFYCLNIPGAESTWCFDLSTGLWHERTYLGTFGQERHRVEASTVAFGRNVVVDYSNSNVYTLDSGVYTDDGESIARMRTAPHISKNMKRIFHNMFQLDLEPGVGLDGTGEGTNPKATLEWSDDGGHSWSSARTREIGRIGEKARRVIWRRLGSSFDRVYRVTITDPVKVVLIGAQLDLEEGAA